MGKITDFFSGIFSRGKGSPSTPPVKVPEGARVWKLDKNDLRWSTMDDVRRALPGATFAGTTVKLNGGCIDGRNIPRTSNSQNEKALGVSIRIPEFRIIDGFIKDVPGGLKIFTANCRVEGIDFLEVGEDAISTIDHAAVYIQIRNCRFWGGRDKYIQLNNAMNALVRGCKFYGGETAIRINKYDYKMRGVLCYVQNCYFEACATGMNVAGDAIARIKSLEFNGVRKKWVTDRGGKVVDWV